MCAFLAWISSFWCFWCKISSRRQSRGAERKTQKSRRCAIEKEEKHRKARREQGEEDFPTFYRFFAAVCFNFPIFFCRGWFITSLKIIQIYWFERNIFCHLKNIFVNVIFFAKQILNNNNAVTKCFLKEILELSASDVSNTLTLHHQRLLFQEKLQFPRTGYGNH